MSDNGAVHRSLSLAEKRELVTRMLRKQLERPLPRCDEDRSLEQQRQRFPALANKSYFNYGAHGVMARESIDAILESYEFVQKWGPFSTEVNEWVQQEINRTTHCFSTLLGAPAETIALTENATMACNIVLWGIDWKAGDHILLSDCENPGVAAAIESVAQRYRLEVSTCPLLKAQNEEAALDAIARNLRINTRLVVVSQVLWNSGQVLPIAEIAALCHARRTGNGKIRVLIDGAQSLGVLPLQLTAANVDFFAYTGHKWLCGPEGVGGLFVSPEALEELLPTFVGWRSVNIDKTDGSLSWHRDARRFQVSTSAYPLFAGLRKAVAIHNEFQPGAERYQRIRTLSQYLWEKLNATAAAQDGALECLQSAPPQAGIVVIRMSGQEHQKVVHFLEARHCFVRFMYDPQCLRFCVHYFTTNNEIDRLVELIKEYTGRRAAVLDQPNHPSLPGPTLSSFQPAAADL
jgi:L-cysteine/cystine lyase